MSIRYLAGQPFSEPAMNAPVDLLRARPSSIAIEVSSRCNLRCSYCHKADDVLEAMPGANDDMTEAMIADVYRYCKAAGIRNVTLSVGGETTVVPDWHKRVAPFLDDPEIETHMVSNFARPLRDEELEAFTRLNALQVSFDSADPGMVRKLRSKADLGTIAYNIIRLRQAARERGRGPFLVVNCTLCRDNVGHVAKLAGFCRELGVDQLLLTEVMTITQHNPSMPETLDRLNDDEVILLARQIIAAEDAVAGSATALRLRDHLRARIEEIVEQLREGRTPAGAADYFNRRMESAGCHQPWQSPMVGATGRIIACCGSGPAGRIGNLATQGMSEVMDGAAARAIRASILAGQPTVACETCSFARDMSFPEFAREIRSWLGDTSLSSRETDQRQDVWPGLLGASGYPVVVENAALRTADGGQATLCESMQAGYHRVFFDIRRAEYSQLAVRLRPVGRRRLRLDCCLPDSIVGRAHIRLSQRPALTIPTGAMRCVVAPADEGWYDVSATFPVPQQLSAICVFLMREDEAVDYRGDGRSGLEISGLQVA
jgi:MoaA/NifB/PqqE/SkfB family radical SAM enzyme